MTITHQPRPAVSVWSQVTRAPNPNQRGHFTPFAAIIPPHAHRQASTTQPPRTRCRIAPTDRQNHEHAPKMGQNRGNRLNFGLNCGQIGAKITSVNGVIGGQTSKFPYFRAWG